MQKASVIAISIILTIIIVGYYKLSFASTPPPTAPLDGIPQQDTNTNIVNGNNNNNNNSPPALTPPDNQQAQQQSPKSNIINQNNKKGATAIPSDNQEDGNEETKQPDKNAKTKKVSSSTSPAAAEEPEETDPPLDDGKFQQSANTPSRAGCIDVSHEETANQVELTARMKAFRPSASMWKQVWNSDTNTVFTTTQTEIPPIMKQWLFCFTRNYSGAENAFENQDCTAELAENAPKLVHDGKYFLGKGNLDKCTIAPIYQGNITSYETLRPIYTQFPGPLRQEERSLKSISESRSWYWKNIHDPFSPSCPTCEETKNLLHPTFLVGTRRWFSVAKWLVYSKKIGSSKTGGDEINNNALKKGGTIITEEEKSFSVEARPHACMVLMENSIRTTKTRGSEGTCTGLGQPTPGVAFNWEVDFPFANFLDIAFVFEQDKSEFPAFFVFTVLNKEKETIETHLISTVFAGSGTLSIWTSLQMLYGYDISIASNNNNNNKFLRGLFSPNQKDAIFPRDITKYAMKLRCHLGSLLAIPYSSENPKSILPNDPSYRLCWNELISVKTKSVLPFWDVKKTKLVGALGDTSELVVSSSSIVTQVPATQTFPYLPCHPPYTTGLVTIARANNNMDSHGLYWAFSCSRIANRRPCLDQRLYKMLRLKGQEHAPKTDADWKKIPPMNKIRMKDIVRPKVAVCMAGFIRSFHLTRFAIFQNLVDPYDADFFAASWNIQGRSKKTDPILKSHIINLARMRQRIKMMIPQDRNVSLLMAAGRYGISVLSYKMWEASLADWKLAGWRHAGLYMLLARALEMAVEQADRTSVPYDVVIRGRFDLVPLVPLRILPVWNTPDIERRVNLRLDDANSNSNNNNNNNNNEKVPGWIIDTGSSCEMDGFWWPRTAILREGVVVAHTADTRYKLFSWQYCDWLHIGTYNTMKRMSTIYTWALANYVDSGAQFVEHVWAIDQGLRFYPMQLYLKILRETRKKPRKNGKKVLRIRMHLFG